MSKVFILQSKGDTCLAEVTFSQKGTLMEQEK
jgi:hypothetical protein